MNSHCACEQALSGRKCIISDLAINQLWMAYFHLNPCYGQAFCEQVTAQFSGLDDG